MSPLNRNPNNNHDDDDEKVAELLNEASLSAKESIKISNLKHVQEIIMHQCPTLLDNFIEVGTIFRSVSMFSLLLHYESFCFVLFCLFVGDSSVSVRQIG